jgi:hypothetical protein
MGSNMGSLKDLRADRVMLEIGGYEKDVTMVTEKDCGHGGWVEGLNMQHDKA